jgi:hypothetical protein
MLARFKDGSPVFYQGGAFHVRARRVTIGVIRLLIVVFRSIAQPFKHPQFNQVRCDLLYEMTGFGNRDNRQVRTSCSSLIEN